MSFLQRLQIGIEAELRVSTVAVICNGHILMGLRRDNGKWTLPGGHADAKETDYEAGVRELFEEAGIMGPPMEYMVSELVVGKDGKKRAITAYRMDLERFPVVRSKFDPDEEVQIWDWVPMLPGHPRFNPEGLHSPQNIVLRQLGLLPQQNL